MTVGEAEHVHVHRWSLRARSANPPADAAVLKAAVEAAFDRLEEELGPELVVFDRLELHARAFRSSRGDLSGLTGELLAILRRKVRSPVPNETRIFATEADARLRLLEAIVRQRQAAFPWRALRHWGESLGSVDQWPRPVLGDALARLTEEDRSWLGPEMAARWIRRWSTGAGPRLDLAMLPPELGTRHRDAALHGSDPVSHLLAVAALFRDWPPARTIDLPVAPEVEGERSLPSRAGHLILWGALLSQIEEPFGLEGAADIALARWALGRSLSAVQVSDDDPGLLVFAGERPEGHGPALSRFAECSPEPFARWALRALPLEGAVQLGRLYDGTTVLFDTRRPLAVWFDTSDPLVSSTLALREALGESVPIEEAAAIPESIRDGLQRNDVPRFPSAWRSASIAAASVLEGLADERWGAPPPRTLVATVGASGVVRVTDPSDWGDRARRLGGF